MNRTFNTDGYCDPELNYMVDLSSRLKEIKAMVDAEKYFTINRARQYGKTTILTALADYLKKDYDVISLDSQMMSALSFESEQTFVAAFSEELLDAVDEFPEGIKERLESFVNGTARINSLQALFKGLQMWCSKADRKIVMIIDEVDTASNNQVFLDFLAQLRAYYLKRRRTHTFQSVILAGVYDVRNMIRKIRPDEVHKTNSPWNISAKFRIDMSFDAEEIAGMLEKYEADYQVGMNVKEISELIYDYSSGYPYLASALCKYVDEEIAGTSLFPDKKTAWTKAGVLEAVKRLLSEKNSLFDSLIGRLKEYPELKDMICLLLFQGQVIAYNADDQATDMLLMFGFVRVEHETIQIANRIFETRLYNYFLTLPEIQSGDMYRLALRNKNQFIQNGRLYKTMPEFINHTECGGKKWDI
ncbi:MAG: AAA-like domain-containing protein [Lachnospiraceae bacterium]|nr:AAA-like domain-containing protein [Lachnospiraceae bacterium]